MRQPQLSGRRPLVFSPYIPLRPLFLLSGLRGLATAGAKPVGRRRVYRGGSLPGWASASVGTMSQGFRRATEGSVAKKEIPQKWIGDEVEVSIRTDVPEEATGKLKEVNGAGIVVAFTVKRDDKDYRRTVFYPWQTVNWIRPAEVEPL